MLSKVFTKYALRYPFATKSRNIRIEILSYLFSSNTGVMPLILDNYSRAKIC